MSRRSRKIPLVAATQNPGKLREMRRVLRSFPQIDLRGLPLGFDMPEETGASYYANAAIKADAAFEFFEGRYPCFGEDSGLEIAALNDMPGLYTARFLAPRPYAERMEIVLDLLRYAETRAAAYVAEIVLNIPTPDGAGEVVPFAAAWRGWVADKPRGKGGFAYDPIFVGAGACGKTAAQLAQRQKDALSHRGQALREMAAWLVRRA